MLQDQRRPDRLRVADPTRALLPSFFMAGFECSSQRRLDGRRLDLLDSTGHAQLVRADYQRIALHGMKVARDGLRWHLIESSAGHYSWDSWLPMVEAARAQGIKVIWDLCHYGWPDHLDIWSAEFIDSFARFSRTAARILCSNGEEDPYFCPVNEISYFAWAAGQVGRIHPGATGRGEELKQQLIRAYLAAVRAVREVAPKARFLISEPLIHIVCTDPADEPAAEAYRLAQYAAHDMIAGRARPELGGSEEDLDVIGANFYPDNQWYWMGSTIPLGHHAYRPLSRMLRELRTRYHRPVLISETGAEGAARPSWLHHVCHEVYRAARSGVAIEGVCLYPIIDYPGWDNDRLCTVGLFTLPTRNGQRRVHRDLLVELQHHMQRPADRIPRGLRKVAAS
jgi:beta-glucosidase/6-phospho-beta-glucosidase/beta-galactosidase